jgi:hypothetical protein
MAYHALRTAQERVELSQAGGVYSLRLADGGPATFERVDAAPPCVELLERAPRALRFRLADCPVTTAIFYFSEGRMRPLPAAPRAP